MNKNWKIIIIVILIRFSLSAQEKTWQLKECIAYALEHNLQVNDFEFNEQSGRESYRQSIRSLLPNIDAATTYFINYGRSTDPFTNDIVTTDFFSNTYNINLSIDVFQGFQKINNIKASKFLYSALKEDNQQQKYLLAFRIMQAFYDIQFFEGLTRISKEQLAVSQSNYNLVQKQLELGLKAGADLYEAESQLLTDKLNVTQAENQLEASKLRLIQEMNLKNANDIAIQTEIILEDSVSEGGNIEIDTIFNKAKDFLPLIKSQQYREKAAKKQLDVARGSLYPSLSFFAGIGTGYFETTSNDIGETISFRDQFRDNTFQFIGVSLSIPISNGWANRSQVQQQKIEYQRAQNDLDVQEQELYRTIQALVQDYNSLLVEVEQSKQKIKSQSLAFTIAQKRYEKGLISTIELFTAKNLLTSAQNENLQIQLRSQINKSTLDFYRGLPIFNMN
ncbi:TolC family protein [Gaetbulibacter jejuensis]|uniref:TolC family protein n=1 Tax=Gaetbulibacter jejuensis TaxID=584607 RepID=A0ABP3UUH8_9FLAO